MNDKNNQVALEVTLRDKISDRIKDSFVELIPEETWKTMVQVEIDKFKRESLPQIIKAELQKKFYQIIVDELNKSEYQANWYNSSGGPKPSEAVIEITKQITPDLIASMWGAVIQKCVEELRNNLPFLIKE